MTSILMPPFKVALRLAERSSRDPDEVSLRRLREIVAGRSAEFPRSQAMHLLLRSDFPNKHRDLAAVLENEREPEDLRRLAAVQLGKINTRAAKEILVKNISIGSQQVLAGIFKALGRVGGKAELDAVLRAKEYADGHTATQAAFAAALISHREGLDENEWPMPDKSNYLKLPKGAARPFSVARAADSDAELCLRSIASQPFGIEYVEQPMYQVRCGRRVLMILLNRDFAGLDAAAKACERKALPCVVATRSEETGSYSIAYLLLTSPAPRRKGTINLLITRATGEPVFGGTAQVRDERAEFNLRAVSRPGAVAVEIEGAFTGAELKFENAQSALFAQVPKREPLELRGRRKVERPGV